MASLSEHLHGRRTWSKDPRRPFHSKSSSEDRKQNGVNCAQEHRGVSREAEFSVAKETSR